MKSFYCVGFRGLLVFGGSQSNMEQIPSCWRVRVTFDSRVVPGKLRRYTAYAEFLAEASCMWRHPQIQTCTPVKLAHTKLQDKSAAGRLAFLILADF